MKKYMVFLITILIALPSIVSTQQYKNVSVTGYGLPAIYWFLLEEIANGAGYTIKGRYKRPLDSDIIVIGMETYTESQFVPFVFGTFMTNTAIADGPQPVYSFPPNYFGELDAGVVFFTNDKLREDIADIQQIEEESVDERLIWCVAAQITYDDIFRIKVSRNNGGFLFDDYILRCSGGA